MTAACGDRDLDFLKLDTDFLVDDKNRGRSEASGDLAGEGACWVLFELTEDDRVRSRVCKGVVKGEFGLLLVCEGERSVGVLEDTRTSKPVKLGRQGVDGSSSTSWIVISSSHIVITLGRV